MTFIVVTAGDPNGIGPEVILKTLQRGAYSDVLVIGDPNHFADCAKQIGLSAHIVEADRPSSNGAPNTITIYPIASKIDRSPGQFNPDHAPQIVEVLENATAFCLDKTASAMVTAPINKGVLKEGVSFEFPGHTEFLADRAHVARPVMMLVAPGLRTVPTTIHIPVAEVPTALTPALLRETIQTTHQGLRDMFRIAQPKLVVAGLNPHAGEEGKIGTEERDWIQSEIANLYTEGFDISGPYPADTLFHEARRNTYDAAICMYHDQALIPVKTLGFDDGINVTLGLPFVRTSPDHGTAFDIASRGIARPNSFENALRLANTLVGPT